MNKNAIKNYAVWARNELITRVTQKAFEYGVSKDNIVDSNADSINGRLLTSEEKKQRQQLISDINYKGFDQVIEEVAYTWFNRFIALRYMEVNNYLPNRIRIFTNDSNEFKPQILDEAMNINLEGLDNEVVFDLLEKNKKEELYKQLIIAICNDMGNYLPGMFTKIADYKVLLFPDNVLRSENVVGKLISDIDEDSWLDQVQIIGWMYQYYVSEKHNQVINIGRGTVKKEDIPAATQLFTTDWIVRYMVDNSLGRYWIERNPESTLIDKLKFLATSKNGKLPHIDETIDPKKLTFIDDCMGSGHILVYAFDLLMEIYRECGYSDRDAAQSIIENNLSGLDIDERAYQLAYFAVMMKGRSYNRRLLSNQIANNLTDIVETNELDSYDFDGMPFNSEMDKIGRYLIRTFKNAKELGSLVKVDAYDYDLFEKWITDIYKTSELTTYYLEWAGNVYPQLLKICKQAKILSNKYIVVTTNPPYLSKMEGNLKDYVVKNYKEYSSDLFAVFMKKNFDLVTKNGYLGFMTPFVWMFIKSYENLRKYILTEKSIATLVQLEYSAYEEATVPICTFVLSNNKKEMGYYYKLSDFKGGMQVQEKKLIELIETKDNKYCFESKLSNFLKIPGFSIIFWEHERVFEIFEKYPNMDSYLEVKNGMSTTNNNKFLRLWTEVNVDKICFDAENRQQAKDSNKKWFPYNKGGEYRKWFGNSIYVCNWENDGKEIRKAAEGATGGRIVSEDYYFNRSLSWSKISSGQFSLRFYYPGHLFDVAGPSIFGDIKDQYFALGLANSVVKKPMLESISPTLNYERGHVALFPVIEKEKNIICNIAETNIRISKDEWDSFETSWDFKEHPLIRWSRSLWDATAIGATIYKYYGKHIPVKSPLELCYLLWQGECSDRFNELKSNEEELNRLFIDIYGLHGELEPYVEDKDITVRKADLIRDIKSFISYAVGCMFGRYSLNVEGLAYAGGEWGDKKYLSYIPDSDNIIPICDDEYFSDDIVGRFVEFVKVVYGEDSLEENLQFIADALGGNGNPREVLRNYFLNDFFKDHCNTYQVTGSGKRPIYWLFDSGKKNGFKALVYIHRYTPDLIARMRTQYIHEQQARYRNQIEMLERQIDGDVSTSERVRLNKQLKKFKEQDEELRKYEEKIHHWADRMEPMDLDDGVKANYAKFQELLAKIK